MGLTNCNTFKIYILIILLVVSQVSMQNDFSKYQIVIEDCGTKNPSYASDCHQYSTSEKTCCYYEYGNAIGCTKLATRFRGVVNYGGLMLECLKGDKISYNSLLLNILLFVIIFL
jgi:hypothetical protein